MQKRLMILAAALGLLLALAGCGEKNRARPAPEVPASSSLEVQPPAAEGEQAVPGVDDALVREILLQYGVKEAERDGAAVLVPQDVSLCRYENSWSDPEELSAFQYFVWFFSTILREDAGQRVERYSHPLGENGWFFPQDVYEERIQKYFDVSVEHLREDKEVYHPELEGYWLGGGGGRGLDPTLSYRYSQEGDRLTIDLDIAYPDSEPYPARLSVRLDNEGGWKYTGWECRPPALD